MGAILLNLDMTKCLLVRGFHAAAAWGFPRGKIAKDETDAQCAIREVGIMACLGVPLRSATRGSSSFTCQ